MENINEHYVAHFDMLGMSQLTLTNTNLAWEKLSKLNLAKQHIYNTSIELTNENRHIKNRLFGFTFSDTIIIISLENTIDDLKAMIMLSTQMFYAAISSSVPIRGAISYGKFMFNIDNSMFVGPPLINAYNLGEEAQWLGIVVDDVIAVQARDSFPTAADGQQTIIEWDVNVKPHGTKKRYVINWPPIFRNSLNIITPISPEKLYEIVSSDFGDYNNQPDDVKEKYVNTTTFINAKLF